VAGKKARQRRLARQRYERRAARAAQRAQRVRKWTLSSLAAVAVAGIAVGGVFLFGGGGKNASAASTPSTTPTATASSTPSPSPSASTSVTPVAEPAHHCTYTASPPAARKVSFPPAKPDYKAHYRATIVTNRGNIVIDLLNSKATCTVNSFVSLARQAYFNHTHCHRLTTSGIFVLQCGDPTGTGRGGPGYEFGVENLAGAKYTAGTVAMANSGSPDSNGSQFFLVYKNSLTLPADYTPFGRITAGLNIIQKVAKAGSDNSNGTGDGHPKEKVEIRRVIIKKT
jgi:peptidyl-prolyl cis-trans isomerase B (cyclophilin B)